MSLNHESETASDDLNTFTDALPPNPPQPKIKGTSFYCEHCQRQSGPAMVECGYRATNECPYRLQNGPVNSALSRILGFCLFGLFFLAPLYILVTSLVSSALLTAILLTILPVGLGALFFAVYRRNYRELGLSNPANGFVWHKLTLFGFPLQLEITIGVTPLELDWSMTDCFRSDLPVSIQTLKPSSIVNISRDERILETTLLGLLKCGALTACSPKLFRAYLRGPLKRVSQPNYVLLLNPDKASKVEGELERRIIEAMTSWYESGRAINRSGMTIMDICRALHVPYADDPYWNPHIWILDLVEKDAVRWGIGSLRQRTFLSIPFTESPIFYYPNSATMHLGEQVDLAVMDFFWINAKFGRYVQNQVTYGLLSVSPKHGFFWHYSRRNSPSEILSDDKL